MDPTSSRRTYINTTEGKKAEKSIKRGGSSPPPSNIQIKKRKATHADAKRYAEPDTAIKVFFCDEEKDNISGIIRDVPSAHLSDISQLSESEMFSAVKASTPSFLYLSPNIKSHVLNLVRNLASLSPGNTDTLLSQVTKESVVGIFSRSAESNYRWLKRVLEPRVRRVESTYISSNSNIQFMQATRQCNFGILYHTTTSGRINITDVTDSMYDAELKHLSAVLDKKNVVVVVDDLGNNSDQERRRILQYQPSIAQYAKDLILISKAEKKVIVS